MPVTRQAIVALAVFVLAGCGASASSRRVETPKPVAPPAAADATTSLDTAAIVSAVSKARGLQPKKPIEFTIVDDQEFSIQFQAEVAHRRQVRGLTSLSVSGGSDASYYLAYYDTRLRKVLLRKKTPEWAKLMDQRHLVAHEVEHALQDQYYDLDAMLSAREIDIARAHHALIEGDAEATAAGAVAILDHLPPKRAIATATTISESLGVDTYVAGGLVDPRMAQLKPAVREEMLFPYRHGAAFVGALVRAGGFPLVDRAFVHPPSSSADIIHPDAFVAGRARTVIPEVPEREGWTSSGPKGPYGEFALRNVLTSFGLPADRVRALAQTWRGDSFATLKNANGRTAFAWSIACSDEANALALATTLGSRGQVLQKGTSIGYAEGFPEDEAKAVIASLVALIPTTAPKVAPPFGAITIPPLPPRIEERLDYRATTTGGVVRIPAIGVELAIPPQWAPRPLDPKPGIVALFGSPVGGVVLSIDSTRPTPLVVHAMAGGVITGFKQAGAPTERKDGVATTPLGQAFDMHLGYGNGASIRFLALPTCHAEASLMVTVFERLPDAGVDGEVERWLASLDPKAIDASEWCRQVNLERTTDLP